MQTHAKIYPRSVATVSMFNPLMHGDHVELDGPTGGELWKVGQGGYGWCLHEPADRLKVHRTIKDIPAMADLIQAILEASKV